ncbi:MAG: diguanylate cyclase domain-containing protein [Acidobacteriota bacterium]
MTDRAELVEAALEVYPEGLALVDRDDRVVLWNRTAELLTGHACAQLVGRAFPGSLEALLCGRMSEGESGMDDRILLHLRHLRGHDVPVLVKRVVLRDDLGARIGTAAVFHAADRVEALPHGETGEGSEVLASQAQMRERLKSAHREFLDEGTPFGVLWVMVDQAHDMRRTHGARACEAMLESVERTLANALRPGEEVGRWGDAEFLILSHEFDAEVLGNHGRVLAGRARTAEFFWWGDRASLSVSMGAAVVEPGETLSQLLDRAQEAMSESMQLGGNRVKVAQRRIECSPSSAS